MATYTAPVEDLMFVMEHVIDAGETGIEPETLALILDEAGKMAAQVHLPANAVGDVTPPTLVDGQVRMPPGWHAMHQATADGGWIGTSQNPDFGGQGLPVLVNSAILEILCGANMAYGLSVALTEGAIETLENIASDDLKQRFIPNLISGAWSGTMNLTESQAGSNLAAVRTRAVPDGDHYRISGQKAFISFGDHDLCDNIIHLVVARIDGAPEGVKGISLFVVPKYLVNDDGTPGPRNEVIPISLEHKMGLHGSPTVALSYGDGQGAVGYLVGEENRGLEYMFIMMNRERHMCGVQAIGVAEMALQHATAYAHERVQGTPFGCPPGTPIVGHPDVSRMLMTMRAYVEATRALACRSAAMIDAGVANPEYQAESEFLTPIVKAWSTDVGFDVASLGMQVFGGLGYMEPTGAAQYLRDVRITSIYEGTNGIQANDLVFRKVLRDGGTTAFRVLDQIKQFMSSTASDTPLMYERGRLKLAVADAEMAINALINADNQEPRRAASAAVPFLHLMGIVLGGYYLVRSASIAQRMLDGNTGAPEFLEAKAATGRFYVDHVLCQSAGLGHTVMVSTQSDGMS